MSALCHVYLSTDSRISHPSIAEGSPGATRDGNCRRGEMRNEVEEPKDGILSEYFFS